MEIGYIFLILAIIVILGIILFKLMKKFKIPKVGVFTLVTGGVKSGKSTFGMYLSYVAYKRVHRRWKIRVWFQKLFRRELDEEPLLYSNIPLCCPYSPLTKDILLRKHRPHFNSVIFIDECSLVADSQLIKNNDVNTDLMLYVKLIGHELHGKGALVVNTQSTSDLHYSMRRCCDKRFYVSNTFKWLPFFLIQTIREERYSEDGSIVNAYNEDLEDSQKRVLVRKKVWKMFDSCAFSTFTDYLPVDDKLLFPKKNDLKAKELISFRDYGNRLMEIKDEKENNK